MTLHDTISAAIHRAIDDVNGLLPEGQRLEKTPETVLFGRQSGLDSLGLVNLIVAIERHVEQASGTAVSLSSAEVLLAEPSPFASIRALADFIAARVQQA